MSKKRGHRPPPQGFAQPVPDIRQNMQAKQNQQQQVRLQVEQLAATIYARSVAHYCREAAEGDEPDEDLFIRVCDRSADAALVFARRVWGIQAERQTPSSTAPARKKRKPVQVITEDE